MVVRGQPCRITTHTIYMNRVQSTPAVGLARFFGLTLLTFFLALTESTNAQVERKVVTEHFTNTRCSICASRNPGLRSNLRSNSDVIHISYHPSSPYSSCVLNKHNVGGNDDRTRYYNVYGGTPRVAVQGKALSASTNYSSSSIFNNAKGGMSPISITIRTSQKGMDSLVANVVIKAEATHSLTDMNLYVIAVEDTVYYNAPNGEKEHYNVFRKVLHNADISLPTTMGDSIVIPVRTANHMDWNAERMYVAAMVQNKSTKDIEQIETSKDEKKIVLSVDDVKADTGSFNLYPNPSTGVVYIKSTDLLSADTYVEVSNNLGQVVSRLEIGQSRSIDLNHLTPDIYTLKFNGNKGAQVKRIVLLD